MNRVNRLGSWFMDWQQKPGIQGKPNIQAKPCTVKLIYLHGGCVLLQPTAGYWKGKRCIKGIK